MEGLLLVAGGSGGTSAELYGFATLRTDKPDYSPGDTVTMTGSGWQSGETVTLHLHELQTSEPDRTLAATADESGKIVNNQFQTDAADSGVAFQLTATGAQSQAQIAFTDDPVTCNTDADCDDQDPCTIDRCNPQKKCAHSNAPNGTSCTDGNVCNGAETCLAGPGPGKGLT